MGISNPKILIVDDSEVARQMILGQLQELGYSNFLVAHSGEEALSKLEQCRNEGSQVDLVITDLRMPAMQGAELVKKLSADADFKHIPVLIISVETERGTIVNAVVGGASGYILKPVTIQILRSKLEQIFSKQKA